MKVLVACEESQTVCKAFRERGHEAYSCDIQEPSGGHPEWHILGDALEILNPKYIEDVAPEDRCMGIEFCTMTSSIIFIEGGWDLLIAHPPCTFLTVTGNRWFNVKKYGEKAVQRYKDREDAVRFFMAFANADCPRIAIENPIGYMSTAYRRPDQIIHPYYFAEHDGDENCERKATCLWLKGLPKLKYNAVYSPRVIKYKNGKGTDNPWHMESLKLKPEDRAKFRSKTFPGIASAMADQWGSLSPTGREGEENG